MNFSPLKCCVLIALGAVAMPHPAAALTHRVPADFTTIQQALDAAVEGDSVLVAPGTYSGPGNYDLDFSATTNPVPKNLVLVSEGGPEVTIIDVQGSQFEPRRGISFHRQESSSSVFEGFTVTNGFMSVEDSRQSSAADSEPRHDLSGGGIIIRWPGTSPIIRDCVFINNHSQQSGGGAEVEQFATPTFENCRFIDNTTSVSGGGLAIESNARPTVIDCLFVGNQSFGGGGGVAISTGTVESPIIIAGSTIAGNRAVGSGGGLDVGFPGNVRLERSIVWNNCSGDGTDTHAVSIDEALGYVCSIVDSVTATVPGAVSYDADTRFDGPAFCEPIPCAAAPTPDGDYRVAEDSIALPAFSACGEKIGYEDAGCPATTPVRKSSWSKLKFGRD